jgi:hypothetical protein
MTLAKVEPIPKTLIVLNTMPPKNGTNQAFIGPPSSSRLRLPLKLCKRQNGLHPCQHYPLNVQVF